MRTFRAIQNSVENYMKNFLPNAEIETKIEVIRFRMKKLHIRGSMDTEKQMVYRKADGLEVDCYVLLFLKKCFSPSHMIKMSAQAFARGCKRRIQL